MFDEHFNEIDETYAIFGAVMRPQNGYPPYAYYVVSLTSKTSIGSARYGLLSEQTFDTNKQLEDWLTEQKPTRADVAPQES